MVLLPPERLRSRWLEPVGQEARASVIEQLAKGSRPQPFVEHLPGAGEVGAALDLRGIDLRGLRLEGVDLTQARLDLANLDMTIASNVRLDRSQLAGASLNGSNWRGASMVAIRAQGSSWDNATLDRADLTAANLARVSMRRSSLVGSCLRFATVGGANLRGADLSGADLDQCDFEYAHVASVRWVRRGVNSRYLARAIDLGCPSFADVIGQHMKVLLADREALLDVEVAVETSPMAAFEIGPLFHSGYGWRTEVLAAAAMVMKPEHGRLLIPELWKVIERGSWVVPQLLVAAFLLDERFEERAEKILASTDAKARGSAVELMGHLQGTRAREAAGPEVEGAELARRWLTRLTENVSIQQQVRCQWHPLERRPSPATT